MLQRLFIYLCSRASQPGAPKEFEIAQEVFGKTENFDVGQDASVRVYIHRLRRKLDEFYGDTPDGSDRLLVPRGEYRLIVQRAIISDEGDQECGDPRPGTAEQHTPDPAPKHTLAIRTILIAAMALAITLAFLVGCGVLLKRAQAASQSIARTPTWAPILASHRPTFIVLGDYYIFGEARDTMEVDRLIREFSINSSSDLDQYLMSHPEQRNRFVDLDLHYLPVSAASALSNILPAMQNPGNAGFGRPQLLTMSQMPPEMLKNANVIYVGYLSALGLLRDVVFRMSSFSVGSTYDELIDKRLGKHYQSNWSMSDKARPHLDYGYLASFSGATGNRIIIVSGTRDAGVTQASEVATNPVMLNKLASLAGSGSFEALYEVSTLGTANVGSRLIVARALSAAGTSPAGGFAARKFPDQAGARAFSG